MTNNQREQILAHSSYGLHLHMTEANSSIGGSILHTYRMHQQVMKASPKPSVLRSLSDYLTDEDYIQGLQDLIQGGFLGGEYLNYE